MIAGRLFYFQIFNFSAFENFLKATILIYTLERLFIGLAAAADITDRSFEYLNLMLDNKCYKCFHTPTAIESLWSDYLRLMNRYLCTTPTSQAMFLS